MKISVIIPTFNSSKYISRAIGSVISQTYRPFEVIVIDDGSTDATNSVLGGYIRSGGIKYFYQENKGPGAARNLGIKNSSGEFVAFLDADDVWLPEKLEKQMNLFENPAVGLIYSDMEFFGDKFPFKRYSEMAKRFYRGRVFGKLLLRNFIPVSSVIVRRSVIERYGLFTEEKQSYAIEDYEMWLRIARATEVDFILDPLVKYRVHECQISKDHEDTYRKLVYLYKNLVFHAPFLYAPIVIAKYIENKAKFLIRRS